MLRSKKHSHSQTVGVRIGDMVGTNRTSYTLEDVARLRMCDCSNKVCVVGGWRFASPVCTSSAGDFKLAPRSC